MVERHILPVAITSLGDDCRFENYFTLNLDYITYFIYFIYIYFVNVFYFIIYLISAKFYCLCEFGAICKENFLLD